MSNDQYQVNGGSPVGPGFVVFEREKGVHGYSLEMAKESVGKGWHPLLERIFLALKPDVVYERKPKGYVIQVKEKFGTLRVYLGGVEMAWVDSYVDGLCDASSVICEDCGNPGRIRSLNEGRTWVRTLCDSCHQTAPGRR
jgi:hypothetical protein